MGTQMEGIKDEIWTQWTKKRRNTMLGYMIVAAMVGIDYSFMFTTLYLYLKDMIKTERPTLYYGIIVAAYSISSTIFGVVCGRWVDRTRRIKLYTIMTLIFQIIGCILYVFHFNVIYPLISRLIGGLADPFQSVLSGEIIRIYDKEGSTRALWWLASIYSIGEIVGPLIVLAFNGIDFYIWTIHITQLNVMALIMSVVLLFTLIIAYFLIHDCSAEIDLKAHLKEKITNTKDIIPQNECEEETNPMLVTTTKTTVFPTIPVKVLIKTLSKRIDAILMFTSTLIFMYCLFSSDVLIPLITVLLLDWSLTALSFILIGNGIIYFIILMIMSKYCTSDRAVYVMSIICIIAQIFMFLMMTFMKIFERNLTRDVIFMLLFLAAWVFAWAIEEVLIRDMLAKMIPSNSQSFVEALRNSLSRLSTIVASISAPLVIPFLEWWSIAIIILILLLLLCYVRRWKSLCEIEEIDFMRSTPVHL